MYTRAVVYNRLHVLSRGIMGRNCAQFRNRRTRLRSESYGRAGTAKAVEGELMMS